MSTSSHIEALERRHRSLEQELESEMQHPARDPMRISDIKRKKLELKDEIARLQRQTRH